MKIIQSISFFFSLIPVAFLSIGQENNDIKTRLKIEKRFIHSESKYITISGGWAFTSTHTKDPNNFLKSGLVMMNNHIFPNVRYEHSIGENTFLETSYEFGKIGINMGRNNELRIQHRGNTRRAAVRQEPKTLRFQSSPIARAFLEHKPSVDLRMI